MTRHDKTRETYHHGNLPEVLIQEGAQLLAEVGIEGFNLRRLAQRAGVTVAAPSHHFGSAKGLLTAIATAGFEILSRQMEAAGKRAESPDEVVTAMCRTYVDSRTKFPGYASVMFRLDLLQAADEPFRQSAFHAFSLLEEALTRAVPDTLAAARISTTAKALWATAHGLTTLPMIRDQDVDRILRSTVAAHLDALRKRSQNPKTDS